MAETNILKLKFLLLAPAAALLLSAGCKDKPAETPPPAKTAEAAPEPAAAPEPEAAPAELPVAYIPDSSQEAAQTPTAYVPPASQSAAAGPVYVPAAEPTQSPNSPPQGFPRDSKGRPTPPKPAELRGPGNP